MRSSRGRCARVREVTSCRPGSRGMTRAWRRALGNASWMSTHEASARISGYLPLCLPAAHAHAA